MIPAAPSERRVGAVLGMVVAGVFLLPAATVLWASFRANGTFTFDAYALLWQDARPWRLMWNSLCVAAGTAALATCAGTLLALVAHSLRPWMGKALLTLGALPLLIPPYVAATAWIEWAGRRGVIRTVVMGAKPGEGEWFSLYGVGGAIAVLAMSYYPVVLFFAWTAMARTHRSMVEAGWLHTRPRRVLWRVMLPNAAAGIATGAFIVFMIALANYSVPSLLLVEVYPVEVHTQFSAFYATERATAAALPLLVLASLGALAWRWAISHQPPTPWQSAQTPPLYRAGARAIPVLGTLLVLAVSVAAPVAVLADRAGGWRSYAEVLATTKEELWSSLVLSGVSATLLVAGGWIVAYFARLSGVMRWTGRALLAPFVLSGPLFGIGLILLYNHAGVRGMVYDSIAIVVLACVARFLFFATQAGAAAQRAVPPSLVEAAAVAGLPWWKRFLGIVLPLTGHWAVAAWGVAFVLVFAEADAIVLVAPPGVTPLPARLHSLMHYGPSAYVAALSLLVVAIAAIAACVCSLMFLLLRRMLHERDRHP